jgi:hypothetical protein
MGLYCTELYTHTHTHTHTHTIWWNQNKAHSVVSSKVPMLIFWLYIICMQLWRCCTQGSWVKSALSVLWVIPALMYSGSILSNTHTHTHTCTYICISQVQPLCLCTDYLPSLEPCIFPKSLTSFNAMLISRKYYIYSTGVKQCRVFWSHFYHCHHHHRPMLIWLLSRLCSLYLNYKIWLRKIGPQWLFLDGRSSNRHNMEQILLDESNMLRAMVWMCLPKVHVLATRAFNLYVNSVCSGAFGRELILDDVMKVSPHDDISSSKKNKRDPS